MILLLIAYVILNGIFDFEISELYNFFDVSENDFLLGTFTLLALHGVYQKFRGYILLYRLKP